MTARRLFVLVVAVFVVLVLLALLVTFWHVSEVETMRIVGARDSGGGWYGFWSGFGGSIPDFLIIGSLLTWCRHVNCHEPGCPRPGHVTSKGYRLCKTHLRKPLSKLHVHETVHRDHR